MTERSTRHSQDRSQSDGQADRTRAGAAEGGPATSTRRAATSKPAARSKPAAAPRTSHDGSERRSGGLDARRAAALAAAHVRDMTGKTPEGIVGIERTGDGWRVGVEVLESRRIPDSTDLLAVYGVELDADGELTSYRRQERYHRGRAEDRT